LGLGLYLEPSVQFLGEGKDPRFFGTVIYPINRQLIFLLPYPAYPYGPLNIYRDLLPGIQSCGVVNVSSTEKNNGRLQKSPKV